MEWLYTMYKSRLLRFLRNYVPGIYSTIKDRGNKISADLLGSSIYLNLETMTLVVEGSLSVVAMALAKRLGITYAHWSATTLKTYMRSKGGSQKSILGDKSFPVDIYSVILLCLYYFPDINLNYFFDERRIFTYRRNSRYTAELSIIKDPDTILVAVKNNDDKLIIKEIELMQDSEKRDNLEDPKKARKELESLAEEILTHNDSTSKGTVPVYGDAEEALDVKGDN
jgi:hypothetical protein